MRDSESGVALPVDGEKFTSSCWAFDLICLSLISMMFFLFHSLHSKWHHRITQRNPYCCITDNDPLSSSLWNYRCTPHFKLSITIRNQQIDRLPSFHHHTESTDLAGKETKKKFAVGGGGTWIWKSVMSNFLLPSNL